MADSTPINPLLLAVAFLIATLMVLGVVFLWARPEPRTMVIWIVAAVFGSGFMWMISRGQYQSAAFAEAMIRDGVAAVATVRRVESTGVRYGSRPQVRLTLEVASPGRATRERVVTEVLPMGIAAQPGQRLSIYVDPDDDTRWLIDWSAPPPESVHASDPGDPGRNASARLELLQSMRDRGLVTPEEYEAQRQRILLEL